MQHHERVNWIYIFMFTVRPIICVNMVVVGSESEHIKHPTPDEKNNENAKIQTQETRSDSTHHIQHAITSDHGDRIELFSVNVQLEYVLNELDERKDYGSKSLLYEYIFDDLIGSVLGNKLTKPSDRSYHEILMPEKEEKDVQEMLEKLNKHVIEPKLTAETIVSLHNFVEQIQHISLNKDVKFNLLSKPVQTEVHPTQQQQINFVEAIRLVIFSRCLKKMRSKFTQHNEVGHTNHLEHSEHDKVGRQHLNRVRWLAEASDFLLKVLEHVRPIDDKFIRGITERAQSEFTKFCPYSPRKKFDF